MSEHGPSATAAHGGIKLPAEPYPGLRPFLDFEASLLFGRERQVREVIEHLVNVKGKKRKDLDGIARALNDKGSPLYIDLLHSYVHNLFSTPKVRELRSAWNDAQPFFESVWA